MRLPLECAHALGKASEPIVYDPENPLRMELADAVYDTAFPWVSGGAGAFALVLAALIWWRVIDLQKIDDWIDG